MIHERFLNWAAVAALFALATGAAAADEPVGRIVSIDGTAIVSEGDRYVIASEGRAVRSGDRVVVLEGGRAAIWYGDTCEYFLLDDEVLDVTDKSPCVSGSGGRLQPEVADADHSTEGVRFRLAQMGIGAPASIGRSEPSEETAGILPTGAGGMTGAGGVGGMAGAGGLSLLPVVGAGVIALLAIFDVGGGDDDGPAISPANFNDI